MRFDDIQAGVFYAVERKDGTYPELQKLYDEAETEKAQGVKHGPKGSEYWAAADKVVRAIWRKTPQRTPFVMPWGRFNQVGPNT